MSKKKVNQPEFQEREEEAQPQEINEGQAEPTELSDKDFDQFPDKSFVVKDLLPTREKMGEEVVDRGEEEVNKESLSDVYPILKVIEGNIVQKTEDLMKDYGGSPRSWSRLEDFSLFDDVDPVDSAVWLAHLNPKMPIAMLRKRKLKGGRWQSSETSAPP